MKTPKTAEGVLGETYTALLGSNKNFIISAMGVYAEQARREERERIEKEIKCYRTTLSDIAGMAAESRVSGGDYRNTLLHIQADASWALSEYDKNETEGK